jgi:hypothetical protein
MNPFSRIAFDLDQEAESLVGCVDPKMIMASKPVMAAKAIDRCQRKCVTADFKLPWLFIMASISRRSTLFFCPNAIDRLDPLHRGSHVE